MTEVVDPLGNVTEYDYNRLDQMVSENKLDASSNDHLRSFSYDGVGNLREYTDRNGRVTEWDYDSLYRPTQETWKTGSTTDRTLDYSYDSVGRLTGVDDSDSLATEFEFEYDARGQVQLERQLTGLVGTSVVFDRDYDQVGNRTRLEANLGGTLDSGAISGGVFDFENSYTFDARQQLTGVTQTNVSGANAVAPKHASFSYNAASQLETLNRYSATSASSSDLQVSSRLLYDDAGRLNSITHATDTFSGGWDGTSSVPSGLSSSDMLAAYYLEYDQANRLSDFSSYFDAFQTSYTYDSLGQLTDASSAAISGLTPPFSLPGTEGYSFDENGNREGSGGTSQSDPGTHNRLQTDGTYDYTYDDEGNTLTRTEIASGEVTEYTWDHRNRLTSVTEKTSASGSITQKVEFIYDAFDQRVGKRVDTDGDSDWDRYEAFVWADGQTVLRLEDCDGESTGDEFRIASRYLYGQAVDQVLAEEHYDSGSGPLVDASSESALTGETLWLLADHLGSIRDVVDNNGITRQHVVYDSFGNRILEQDYDASGNTIASSHADAIDTLFGYTGRDWDADVELQYNRARWYDPTTGRWLSQDPIGFNAGDANLYRYVGNGATNATDPEGLREFEIVIQYYFQTVRLTPEVQKEIQRILDDALARHGKKGDSIKLTFKKLSSRDAYDEADCEVNYEGGFLGFGKTATSLEVRIRENPKLARIGFGQGTGFSGSLVPERVFRRKLKEIRKSKYLTQAIAAAIVHEVLYHGVAIAHYHETGYIDASTTLVDPKATLSDEACQIILKKLHLNK